MYYLADFAYKELSEKYLDEIFDVKGSLTERGKSKYKKGLFNSPKFSKATQKRLRSRKALSPYEQKKTTYTGEFLQDLIRVQREKNQGYKKLVKELFPEEHIPVEIEGMKEVQSKKYDIPSSEPKPSKELGKRFGKGLGKALVYGGGIALIGGGLYGLNKLRKSRADKGRKRGTYKR
jgi:hypothetical protein